MQINIKATNFEITPEIKEYIERKVASLEKYIRVPHEGEREVSVAWVEVGRTTHHHQKGDVYRAEIQIRVPHIDTGLRTESTKENLYAAIDEARDQMKIILRRETTRKLDIFRKSARAIKKFLLRNNETID